MSPEIVLDSRQIARVRIHRAGAKFLGSGRMTAYPSITPKMEFCPDWRPSGSCLKDKMSRGAVIGAL